MRIFTTKLFQETGEVAIVDATQAEIIAEAGKYDHAAITVENASGLERWTPQQRQWWKGILLPGLAKDTGDSVGYWETKLKLAVMPDEFHIVCSHIDGCDHRHIPSILILNRKEMREMIEGAVAHLRDETIYGDKFQWVMLPDPELRS